MRGAHGRCEIVTLPVVMMISLHHSPGAVSLAALDDVPVIVEYLEGPLLAVLVVQSPHGHVLQGNDSLGRCLGRVLEIVETPVVENKPPSLPAFPTSALKRSHN